MPMAKFLVSIIILHLSLVPVAVATAAAVTTTAPPPVPTDVSRDRAALLSFLSGVSVGHGGSLANWGSSDFCNWTGIICHPGKQRVAQLVLAGRGIHGVISPSLGNLSFLVVLDLSNNRFTGDVPAELGALSRLRQLSLSNNLLEGAIHADLGFLQKLYYLDLSSNRLSGGIPKTLFCNCSALQYIDLTNNSLAGEIPYVDECRLPDLRYLLLWSNDLAGQIPPALSNSSMLEWVDFESNYLTRVLPSQVFDKLPRLQYLYLSYNNLSSHDRNTNLDPFFDSLRNCTYLQELELAGNDLGGKLPLFISELSPNFRQIHLEDNIISGPIPPNISSLVNLTYLNLSNNQLNGSIPPDISHMQQLERLYLSNNFLSGEIPPSLGKIPHLGLVDFSGNRLTSVIPDTFSNLTQLRRLILHNNQLSGAIPPSLGDCLNLEILDLSYNRLEGQIPTYVAGLNSLKLYLNLSNNHLEGPLPLELSKMDMILALDLSSNKLSSPIPSQLGSCIALEYLNLSGNVLQGPLPVSVAALPYLQVLDVSCNELVGALPESLQVSTSLQQANFSYNNFSGVVPNVGVFANLSADAFLGNSGLCGYIPGMVPCGAKQALHRHILAPTVLALVGVISAVLCLIGCVLVVRARAKQAGRCPIRLVHVEDQPEREHPRISYRELSEATGGFVQSSLIGAGRFGRVYEGTLRDGTRVAVKVLDPKGGGEISGSFKRECEVLKRTRHKNLVRVITTCSKPDFNALVLPLMPNGSLESHLYPHDGGPSCGLDLGQLLNVVSDVAEGMVYLHHYAPVRVVHCDLKPSNVLLDEDMRAVISDFGIARLIEGVGDYEISSLSGSAPCNSITGLLQGSVGYIAPEYGLGGHPSTQGDVYSFGVMLLELISGRRPTDVIFHQGLTLHDWVKNHYRHNADAVISHALLRESPLLTDYLCYPKLRTDLTVELIELGLVCTQHSPSLRPSMVDVCHEITLLKEDLAKRGAAAAGDRSFSTQDSLF